MRVRLPARHSARSGVTLIELLLCIGLISIIASLAVPLYSNADGAREAKDRRNAQTLCSICAVVQATGIPIISEGEAKMDIIQSLREGVTVPTGPLRGRTFSVPNMLEEEVVAAARFLKVENGQLVYNAMPEDS